MVIGNNTLLYKSEKPDKSLGHLIDKIWSLQNMSENGFEGIIIPDGTIDLLFIKKEGGNFEIRLTGLMKYLSH
jgi:hypothetical protein